MDVSDNEATLAEGLSENRGSPVADDPQALAQGAHAYVVSVYASGHHSLSTCGVFARACDTFRRNRRDHVFLFVPTPRLVVDLFTGNGDDWYGG